MLPISGCLLFLHAAGFVIVVLTGTSHLLYVKRTLYGFKFDFLFVRSVPFSWKQMIISSFKVYSFLKALPIAIVGDFYILKNSTQLNKIGYWERKTAGQIQFLHVEWYRCSKVCCIQFYTWGVFIHRSVDVVLKLFSSSGTLWFLSSLYKVFIIDPKVLSVQRLAGIIFFM